jgi:hypothetical protein
MAKEKPQYVYLIPAIVLAGMIFSVMRMWWTSYWLLRDGQQGIAVVTSEVWSGHDAVNYEYTVGQTEYVGQSGRNRELGKYDNVGVGGKSIVYFSASHPWLSSLRIPPGVAEGWPAIIVALLMEFVIVMMIINPKGKRAPTFGGKDKSKNFEHH